MGFVTGALTDVVKRREQSRMEEAEARKEARLAAIRAEERAQDFAQRKELTQYELAERQKMADAELAGRRELTQMELASREKISAADNAARAAISREDNATRLAAAKASGATAGDDEVKPRLFVDPKTGTTIPKPAGVKDTDFILAMQQRHGRNIVPMSAGTGTAIVRNGQDDGGMLPPGAGPKPPKADYGFTFDKNGNLVRSY